MKKHQWYRHLSLADDEYIDEANPNRIIKPKKNKKVFTALATACACLILLLGNLWLFIPFDATPPDVSMYADSEYYSLIQKINVLTYQKPSYKNNADKLWSKLLYYIDPPMDETEGGSNSVSYREITDNQVEGVIEADRIKRTDTHIFYLDGATLRAFAIDGENTKEVGSYPVYTEPVYMRDEEISPNNMNEWEFYLSEDGKTVTVFVDMSIQKSYSEYDDRVKVISLDVSNPAKIKYRSSVEISGWYFTSRKSDGSILLMTRYWIGAKRFDFSDESTFLPQIKQNNSRMYTIPAEDVIIPEKCNQYYTVMVKLDEQTLDLQDAMASLSYVPSVYFSKDDVFLIRPYTTKETVRRNFVLTHQMSEITCISYSGNGLEKQGSVSIEGVIEDQWSMDVYNSVFRVFTTTKIRNSAAPEELVTNANLYCIDLNTFEVVASVLNFAPPNESIRSARFDKDTAYACTAIVTAYTIDDPVFFFDLSDLNNITYKDTGSIKGFSTSLIQLGNGYLLGIGPDGEGGKKVEIFAETDNGVRSVCTYTLNSPNHYMDYKSYYVDRDRQLFGFGAVDVSYREGDNHDNEYRYILLHFDGQELVELFNAPLPQTSAHLMRGVYIDGYLYAFGKECFIAQEISIPDQL